MRRRFVPTATLDSIDLDSSAMTSPTAVTQTRPEDLEPYRRELTGYCYRMLGSGFEAEDAVQETMVRAWRAFDRFEGRSSRALVALPHRHQRLPRHAPRPQRRARPMELGPSSHRRRALAGRRCPSTRGCSRSPDARVLPDDGDPAEIAAARESIRLAFVAALQHLPARQRAVLILREVLRWQADRGRRAARHQRGVGQQRAAAGPGHARRPRPRRRATPTRSTPSSRRCWPATSTPSSATTSTALVDAAARRRASCRCRRYDLWLRGPERHERVVPRSRASGAGVRAWSRSGQRLRRRSASYRADPEGGHAPWAIQVIEISGDRIVGHHNFLDTELFAAFGLPIHLP